LRRATSSCGSAEEAILETHVKFHMRWKSNLGEKEELHRILRQKTVLSARIYLTWGFDPNLNYSIF